MKHNAVEDANEYVEEYIVRQTKKAIEKAQKHTNPHEHKQSCHCPQCQKADASEANSLIDFMTQGQSPAHFEYDPNKKKLELR